MLCFHRMGETVNKMAYKMEESDSWFQVQAVDMNVSGSIKNQNLSLNRSRLYIFALTFTQFNEFYLSLHPIYCLGEDAPHRADGDPATEAARHRGGGSRMQVCQFTA